MERQSGITPPELVPVDCPEEIKYLWSYFLDISFRRTKTESGPNPISHSELESWARRNRYELQPFEYRALDALESTFLGLNKPKEKKK